MPSDSSLKRRLVRKASPSPANMRVGSSPSRLNAKVPAVYGKLPGTLSSSSHLRISPWSSYCGSATLRIFVPDSDCVVSAVRIAVADLHDVLVAGVGLLHLRPHREQLLRARFELGFA